jgi:IS30 family transposase
MKDFDLKTKFEHLKKQGITLEEIAVELGVCYQTVWRWRSRGIPRKKFRKDFESYYAKKTGRL